MPKIGEEKPFEGRFVEAKTEGMVQFFWDDPKRPVTQSAPTPIGKPHPATFHLVEFRLDPTTVAWFGAAEVVCDAAEVTREATAAGMKAVLDGYQRDPMDYVMQIRLADGRRGATRIVKSYGLFDGQG